MFWNYISKYMSFKNKKKVDLTAKSFVIAYWYNTAH